MEGTLPQKTGVSPKFPSFTPLKTASLRPPGTPRRYLEEARLKIIFGSVYKFIISKKLEVIKQSMLMRNDHIVALP